MALLASLASVAVGLAVGSALVPPPLPPALARSDKVLTITPEIDTYADPRQVTVSLSLSEPPALRTSAGGVLTTYACQPGVALTSGEVVGSIDEQPVVMLHTSTPLWRDLVGGEEGADVTALQTELGRLGYSVDITGTVEWGTLKALKRFYADRGFRDRDGFHLETVAWTEAESIVPEECPVQIGARLTPEVSLAVPRAEIMSAQVHPLPQSLVSGARTLTIGATSLPVDDSGRSIDDVSGLRDEQAVQNYFDDPDGTLGATLALTEPIQVLAVPPSSVVVDGDRTCVSNGSMTVPVEVIASRLGSTLVRTPPEARAPGRVVVRAGGKATACE